MRIAPESRAAAVFTTSGLSVGDPALGNRLIGPGADGIDPPALSTPFADGPAGPSVAVAFLAAVRAAFGSPETRASFATAVQHQSLNPSIDGTNGHRGKDTLFVGDLMFQAGLCPPTTTAKGWDGAVFTHYQDAERWPNDSQHFDRVTDLSQLRPGDLLVADALGTRGPTGAHIEIVTNVAPDAKGRPHINTMGARSPGLVEDSKYGKQLLAAKPNGDRFSLDLPEKPGSTRTRDIDFYVLRPRVA